MFQDNAPNTRSNMSTLGDGCPLVKVTTALTQVDMWNDRSLTPALSILQHWSNPNQEGIVIKVV